MAPTAQLSSQNPWPGLSAFTEIDRDFFFGRERETSELVELVRQAPAGVLYGQSGLGKTSLVQAGLFPQLKQLDFLPFRVRFDHGDDAPPQLEDVEDEDAEADRAEDGEELSERQAGEDHVTLTGGTRRAGRRGE